jgi:hypothetical protein
MFPKGLLACPRRRLASARQLPIRHGDRAGASPARAAPAPPAPPALRPLPQSASVTVTDSMVTVSSGVPEDVPTESMAATTSNPVTTFPNREYWGGS